MDLSDLQIFSAVVHEGSVTRAAERLRRVQSNVTTRIRQLEEDLRVTLFIREGKRLHLAPAGQVLLGYAERLLALAEEARGAVHDEQPRGTFRLGAMESTAAVRLPGLLSEYHKRHPGVVLELRTGNHQLHTKRCVAFRRELSRDHSDGERLGNRTGERDQHGRRQRRRRPHAGQQQRERRDDGDSGPGGPDDRQDAHRQFHAGSDRRGLHADRVEPGGCWPN